MGDDFWQYRPAQAGDDLRRIDWRRSARSDDAFVQDKEWQIAQTVLLWADNSQSMTFHSADALPTKRDRARPLALATAILLNKGGERFGLIGGLRSGRGSGNIEKLAAGLISDDTADFGTPTDDGLVPQSRMVCISDFLGDLAPLRDLMAKAVDRNIKGILVQTLDPQEETFPFYGRTVLTSMTGALQHETLQASALRTRYLAKLAARKDALHQLARSAGWQVVSHHTDQPAMTPLLTIYSALAHRS